ncbi:hypothetical protein KY290_032363 [Solanum tuberosum]|uniref:Uncharacterized protein n=1 Tax=Solanum tuberosum TaxID=4113 RepID=A0ABQ7UBW6_SOLTU|nr:hypothetical protein KY290_032363 [Solanum tuberosum]
MIENTHKRSLLITWSYFRVDLEMGFSSSELGTCWRCCDVVCETRANGQEEMNVEVVLVGRSFTGKYGLF